MSVLDGTPRRIILAVGLAMTMAVTPAAATALIGAVPRSAADPAGPCTVVEHHSSAYLYCAPGPWNYGNGPWSYGNGAPSEMGLTAASSSGR
jgi:hypothetical protein